MVTRRHNRHQRAMHRQHRLRPLPVPPDEPAAIRRPPPASLLGSGLIPANFEQQGADIEHDYTSRLAELAGGEQNLYRDAGFRGQIDPTTGQVSYSTDPTATFGKYQTMLRSLAENLAGARSDALSRGIGGGGLAQARAGLARFAGSQDQAEMMHSFMDSAADIYRQRGQALTDKNQARTALEGEAQSWWNENAPPDFGQQSPVPPNGVQRAQRAHRHVARMARAHYFPHRGRH